VAAVSSTGNTEFVQQNGYTMKFGVDSKEEGSAAFKVTSIPMTVFFNRSGQIASTVVGGMDKAALDAELAKII
jgi:hypothetical protein